MWGMGFIWLGELVDSGNLDLRRWVGGSGCLWNTRCLKDEHPEAHANTSQDGAPPPVKSWLINPMKTLVITMAYDTYNYSQWGLSSNYSQWSQL